MIECNDLIKIFTDEDTKSRVPALRGCDLSIRKGEIFTIVGPSGSGKTTLINILAGLETISSGDVRVGDYQLELMTPEELNPYRLKMIGIVDQFPERTLFLDGTVQDNVDFMSGLVEKTTPKNGERNEEILQKLGIDHLKDRSVRTLSGGEMIRTAIACALVKGSPILLCDEPTGQLDSLNTNRVKDLLKQVSREFGTAVLVVTHDPRFLRGVDKTCEIRDGRVSAVLGVEEHLAFSGQTKFPLKYKGQIDTSSSVRLPDIVLKTLRLDKDVEFEINEESIVKIQHPKGIKPEKIKIKEMKKRRETLSIEQIPKSYFKDKKEVIQLNKVSKIYSESGRIVRALSDINLSIYDGELVFILGPSGSGKTTLVKLISGLEQVSEGGITILDSLFSSLSDEARADFRREKMGLVSQQGNLHPFLTIKENFYLKDIFSGKRIRAKTAKDNLDYLRNFEIEHRLESFPLEISGGELQRASLALANYEYPPIIILDEPTANLDSELATQAMEKIYEIHNSMKITFLIATHDITLIKDGMRAIELLDGKIDKDGFVVTKEIKI